MSHNKLWKSFQEIKIPKLPYLHPKKPVSGQEEIEMGVEKWVWFQTGKGYQGCTLSYNPFNFYAEYIM